MVACLAVLMNSMRCQTSLTELGNRVTPSYQTVGTVVLHCREKRMSKKKLTGLPSVHCNVLQLVTDLLMDIVEVLPCVPVL